MIRSKKIISATVPPNPGWDLLLKITEGHLFGADILLDTWNWYKVLSMNLRVLTTSYGFEVGYSGRGYVVLVNREFVRPYFHTIEFELEQWTIHSDDKTIVFPFPHTAGEPMRDWLMDFHDIFIYNNEF